MNEWHKRQQTQAQTISSLHGNSACKFLAGNTVNLTEDALSFLLFKIFFFF